MKTLNELLLSGKQDFENSWLTDKRLSDESVVDFKITYSEEFKLGTEEGCKMYVYDNHLIIPFIFESEVKVTYSDGDFFSKKEDIHEMKIPVGYKTSKGYFSKKKLDVSFEYQNKESLTLNQAFELMKFKTDAKTNTFDPFYHENKAKMRNAAAWNYIAKNFMNDPYCTR